MGGKGIACGWKRKGTWGEMRGSRAYSFTRRCLIWNLRHLRLGGKERREGKRRRRRSTRNPAAEHFEPGGGTCAPPSMTLAPSP